jgi:hypothetical protein
MYAPLNAGICVRLHVIPSLRCFVMRTVTARILADSQLERFRSGGKVTSLYGRYLASYCVEYGMNMFYLHGAGSIFRILQLCGIVVVKALCYKPEGRRFDTR